MRVTSGFLKAARGSRSLTLSVILAWAAGLGLGSAALGALSAHGAVWSHPLLRDGLGLPAWRPLWSPATVTAGELQGEALRLLALVAAVLAGLLIGVATVNLVTLLLTRAAARRTEISMRAALGAGPRRLVVDLLKEAGGLVITAGVAGLAIAAAGSMALRRSWRTGAWPWEGAHSAFAVALCFAGFALVTLACWLFPLSAALRADLRRFLGEGNRATPGPGEGVLRRALVVLQVSASLILLVVGGILVRGFAGSGAEQVTGFDPRELLTFRVDLPAARYPDAESRAAAYAQMIRRIDALPGVVDTSAASQGAWLGIGATERVTAVCQECSRGIMFLPVSEGPALIHSIGPGFFRSIGAHLLSGREFGHSDGADAPRTAVINDAFAYQLFPNGQPLGKWIRLGGLRGERYQVIGVVRRVGAPAVGAAAGPTPAVYLSLLQYPPASVDFAVRVRRDAPALAAAIDRTARGVARGAVTAEFMNMKTRLAMFRAPLAWFGGLLAVLAFGALLVATSSVYGVTTYGIERRRREIGIRMAIGATAGDVLRLLVGQSVRIFTAGSVVGLIGALSVGRLLQQRIPGIDVLDALVYAPISLLLACVAVVASYRPAKRAAYEDPQLALREGRA
ncbi:MAG: ABC transporter permease [Gemmatimonadetes bacterium]|nr:ABC transporter permease [Gemmatimonadota bacterium]